MVLTKVQKIRFRNGGSAKVSPVSRTSFLTSCVFCQNQRKLLVLQCAPPVSLVACRLSLVACHKLLLLALAWHILSSIFSKKPTSQILWVLAPNVCFPTSMLTRKFACSAEVTRPCYPPSVPSFAHWVWILSLTGNPKSNWMDKCKGDDGVLCEIHPFFGVTQKCQKLTRMSHIGK